MKNTKGAYHHGNLRSALLKTAARMIAKEGIHRVTMRELSQRIGVSRTAAYRHFQSKNDLLCAVAADGFSRLEQRFEPVRAKQSRSARSRMRRIGAGYVEFAVENPAVFRLMFGHEIVQRDRTPALRAAARSAFDQLVRVIEEGKTDGQIRSGSTLSLANTAWVAVHGLTILLIDGQLQANPALRGLPTLLTRGRMRDSKDVQRVTRYAIDFVIDGLTAGAGGGEPAGRSLARTGARSRTGA